MSRILAGAFLSFLLFGATSAASSPSPLSPEELLARADAPRGTFSEGVIRLRLVANRSGRKPVEDRIELFLKGTDRSLLVFREGKQKGRKILTQGDRVFLIVPGASRAIPVNKSQRVTASASFGDIARLRLADEYNATLEPEGEHVTVSGCETGCRVLDLEAKNEGAAYPTAVLWVSQDDGLARRLLLSLASGKKAKDVSFTRYNDEHRIATMEIRDLLVEGQGNVTHVTFLSYEKRALDPAIFDPEGARGLP